MTYSLLNLVFLVVVGTLTLVLTRRARAGRQFWHQVLAVFGALAVLTIVFDSIMIWADLFRYSGDKVLGLEIGLMPVEDLAWPLASSFLLPAIWLTLGRRSTARARQGDTDAERNGSTPDHSEPTTPRPGPGRR